MSNFLVRKKLVSFLKYIYIYILYILFPGGSFGKESTCTVGDPASIPGWGESPGEGYGNALHYSCLEKPMDRGA